jgi:hypothetical protein
VRLRAAALGLASLAWAQSNTTNYITDVNGNRVAYGTSTSSDHTKTEVSQSVNGREVPLQRVEERVLRKDSSGAVTERITRDYNRTGDLISTQRVVTEESALAGGGSRSRSTTYRNDVNGREQEWERSTVETRVQGNATKVDTAIERPSPNGGFQAVEKRTSVSDKTGPTTSTTESVFRRNDNGDFYEALRKTDVDTVSGNQTTKRKAQYEPDMNGQLELNSQSVASTTKQSDGSEQTKVDIFARSVPGVARESGAATTQVQEQQIITRRKAADGSVVETLSVRRPTINDPARLGPLQPISETVCRGKCEP